MLFHAYLPRKHSKKVRFVSLIAVAVTFSVYAFSSTVNAQHHAPQSNPSYQSTIQEGLEAGANFDVTYLSNDKKQTYDDIRNSTKPSTNDVSALKHSGKYAALGDSVAAGLGLAPVINPTTEGQACKRSRQAYTYHVARELDMYFSIIPTACSGASAGDLVTKQRQNGTTLQPQLDKAFSEGVPSVITITAGANDLRWADILRKCYAGTCGTRSDTILANALLEAVQIKLNYAFSSINSRSGGNPPTTVITGYYSPLSDECTRNDNRISQQEIYWLNGALSALNKTIENNANSYDFVRFAPVDFTGHDMCSDRPWVQGLNDNAPFHPTPYGQKVIAEAVLSQINR